jgi:metal-responsive CopG/Arc/MetJ family transcriptional regulator
MAMVKTAITLPQETIDLLDKKAKERGMFHDRSRSWLIRYAISETFGDEETDGKPKPDEDS